MFVDNIHTRLEKCMKLGDMHFYIHIYIHIYIYIYRHQAWLRYQTKKNRRITLGTYTTKKDNSNNNKEG